MGSEEVMNIDNSFEKVDSEILKIKRKKSTADSQD